MNVSFPTIRAFIRSLSGVDAHVSAKLSAVLEAAIAVRTPVRLFFGVNPSMDAQVLLDSKTLAAYLTCERALPFKSLKMINN